MPKYNIQDQEIRRALDDIQSQIDLIRTNQPKSDEAIVKGTTTNHVYTLRVSDSDPTSLTMSITDLGVR